MPYVTKPIYLSKLSNFLNNSTIAYMGSESKEYQVTTFSIPKMDCPSEEGLIRMAMENAPGLNHLEFDLGKRELKVFHKSEAVLLLEKLTPLHLGAQIIKTDRVSEIPEFSLQEDEARVLKTLLFINAAMFIVEIVLGCIAQSTGLIADSLDMFADAAVYGISLYAVGKTAKIKSQAATLSGYAQLFLALAALLEVLRRFYFGSEPLGGLMIGVSLLALVANVSCLLLLMKHRKGEVHMQASWIFSTNDVVANLGVIIAGVFVTTFKSPIPDLVIGLIISSVVLNGAIRILRLARK